MKVLCLTDFPVIPPDRWIWGTVNEAPDTVHFLWAVASDRSPRWGKFITRYPTFFHLGLRALRQTYRNDYDLVVAWEGKVGIPTAFLRRVAGCRTPPYVILTFTPGETLPSFYPLISYALKAVDRITVLTTAEQEIYQSLFGFPRARINLCPLGTYDSYSRERQRDSSVSTIRLPYIHASGRSARDYATLFRAVAGLNIKVIVHGRGYNFKGLKRPDNVEIGELVPTEEYYHLVHNSLFEVVPLKQTVLPVGSSQIVFSMMMGKAIVATQTASTVDYIEHGVSGLLVKPGDAAGLRAAIRFLLEHPQEAIKLGLQARQRYEELYTFAKFSHRAHSILQEVALHHAEIGEKSFGDQPR